MFSGVIERDQWHEISLFFKNCHDVNERFLRPLEWI